MRRRATKPIVTVATVLCLWLIGRWLLHFSTGTILLLAVVLAVVAMLWELLWSEKAYRSIERERREHFAREHEFDRTRQRERDF